MLLDNKISQTLLKIGKCIPNWLNYIPRQTIWHAVRFCIITIAYILQWGFTKLNRVETGKYIRIQCNMYSYYEFKNSNTDLQLFLLLTGPVQTSLNSNDFSSFRKIDIFMDILTSRHGSLTWFFCRHLNSE